MPTPIPTHIQGVPTAEIRAKLPDVARFTLNDSDWGVFISACDLAEEPGDSIGDNLRHKYALDAGNVTREDMVQLLANLEAFAYYQASTQDIEDWETTREAFEAEQETAEGWVRDFISCYVRELV